MRPSVPQRAYFYDGRKLGARIFLRLWARARNERVLSFSRYVSFFCGAQEKDETDPIIVEPLRFFRLLQVEITFSFYFLSHSLTQFIFISLSFYFLNHPLTLNLSFVYFLALSFHFLCLSIPQIPLSLP